MKWQSTDVAIIGLLINAEIGLYFSPKIQQKMQFLFCSEGLIWTSVSIYEGKIAAFININVA